MQPRIADWESSMVHLPPNAVTLYYLLRHVTMAILSVADKCDSLQRHTNLKYTHVADRVCSCRFDGSKVEKQVFTVISLIQKSSKS